MIFNRAGTWLAVLAASVLAGCGVDSEDTPQPIDNTTQESGTTPSVDTRPAPTSSSGHPTTSPPPSTTRSGA